MAMRDVSDENIKIRFMNMCQLGTATYGTSNTTYVGLIIDDLSSEEKFFIPMWINPESGFEDKFAEAFKAFDKQWSNIGEDLDG
jgi:hypothetical protein